MIAIEPVAILRRAATFEIDCGHHEIYYTAQLYDVFLNGEKRAEGQNTNVFTLFRLAPSMLYEVRLQFADGQSVSCEFVTPGETMLLDITQFGAVGDGKTDCTGALQSALNACPPGGTVYVPEGVYCSYPVFLQDEVLLYLDKGAVLLGGADRSRYPVLPGMVVNESDGGEKSFASWEGNPLDSYASLLTAIERKNAAVAGEGIVDANAQSGDWWQDAKRRRGAWRPRTIFAVRCEGLTLMGISVRNSPAWTIHPYYCKNVDILDIRLHNPPDSPNTDGCNPESCEDVRIIGACISVGDDCISVKSGKYYMARYHYAPARNILVRNCLLQRGHGAVVLGSEISAGVQNLRVERCLMQQTDRGLRIKTRRGRGATSVIQGIEFSHIRMEGVENAFVANMFYFCDPDGHSEFVESKQAQPVTELTPVIRDIYCHDIECVDTICSGVFFYGLPESPIGKLRLKNVRIGFAKDAQAGLPALMDGIDPVKKLALFAANVDKLVLDNVAFSGNEGETYQLQNVAQFTNDENGRREAGYAAARDTGPVAGVYG